MDWRPVYGVPLPFPKEIGRPRWVYIQFSSVQPEVKVFHQQTHHSFIKSSRN